MINLNQYFRESGQLTLWQSVRSRFSDTIYLAENMGDWLDHESQVSPKKFTLLDFENFHVYIHNVSIHTTEKPHLFLVRDGTGQDLMLWDKRDWFPCLETFQELAEVEGLSSGDFVHGMMFRYLVKSKLASILWVEVHPPSGFDPEEDKIGLLERLSGMIKPVPVLVGQG